MLSVLDRKWREHLYEMDYLKEGIGLRAMAQRDPLVEYQREGFQLFSAMTDANKEESVGYLFNLEVRVAEQASEESGEAAQTPEVEAARTALGAAGRLVAKGIDGPETSVPLQYSAPSEDGNAVETRPAGDSTGDAATTGGQGGNRQERRRASKSQHKQR